MSARLALLFIATALLVFTNERGFSHPGGDADIAVALGAFLGLLLLASRTAIPAWAPRAAYAAILLVDGLAAFRIAGALGAALVAAAVVGLFVA